jgi:lysophospholipase L1-like esterase
VRTAVAVAAAAALGAFALAGGGTAAFADDATGGTAQLAGLKYVALGDSYSAGYGIPPASGEPVPGCAQSTADYPHLLAAQYGLDLTDVSCSGALATNILTPQDTGNGIANPQEDALGPDTQLVTVTLGGNDLGFSDIAASCFAETATGPVLGGMQTCQDIYFPSGGTDSLAAKIAGPVTQDIGEGLAAIKEKAPNAKVFVIEYPAITPDAANTPAGPEGCFRPAIDINTSAPIPDAFPFTTTDVPYLHTVEQNLDAAVQSQAAAAGFTFVPTFDQTLAHSGCGDDPAQRWIQGITITSLNPFTLVDGALHPNADGIAFIQSQVGPAIEAAFPAPTPTPMPTPEVTTAAVPTLANTGSGPEIAPLVLGGLALAAAGVAVMATRRRASAARR